MSLLIFLTLVRPIRIVAPSAELPAPSTPAGGMLHPTGWAHLSDERQGIEFSMFDVQDASEVNRSRQLSGRDWRSRRPGMEANRIQFFLNVTIKVVYSQNHSHSKAPGQFVKVCFKRTTRIRAQYGCFDSHYTAGIIFLCQS